MLSKFLLDIPLTSSLTFVDEPSPPNCNDELDIPRETCVVNWSYLFFGVETYSCAYAAMNAFLYFIGLNILIDSSKSALS